MLALTRRVRGSARLSRSPLRGNVLLRSAACSPISSKFSARVLRVLSGRKLCASGRTITQSGKPSSAAMVVNVMVRSCPSRSLTSMAAPSLPCPILNSAAGTSAIATPATDTLNVSFCHDERILGSVHTLHHPPGTRNCVRPTRPFGYSTQDVLPSDHIAVGVTTLRPFDRGRVPIG